MYKLPDDILNRLKFKYPKIPLNEIIHDVFDEIQMKVFDNGSCMIRGFGTFYTYKSYSAKSGKIVPRFKYKISRSLFEKIVNDEYILDKIQKVENRVFDKTKEQNEKYVKNRNFNIEKQNNIIYRQKILKDQIEENIVRDEISFILEKKE